MSDPVLPTRNSSEPLLVSDHYACEISDDELSEICRILMAGKGFNLDAYKEGCIRRRIAIRVRATHCESVKAYCEHLRVHKPEIDQLLRVLTIHVSQFFRNFSTYEKLRLEILPSLFASAKEDGVKELRFWSLGCAGGEEPFTLALILAEHFSEEMKSIPVRIEATDIDNAVIAHAEAGAYTAERFPETPEEYLVKYFTAVDGQFRISRSIVDMVTFSQGDMFNDEIYSHCHLLICRNALIYFSREQQDRIFAIIAKILDPKGYMVLGKSETLMGVSRAKFETVCPVERIYRLARPAA